MGGEGPTRRDAPPRRQVPLEKGGESNIMLTQSERSNRAGRVPTPRWLCRDKQTLGPDGAVEDLLSDCWEYCEAEDLLWSGAGPEAVVWDWHCRDCCREFRMDHEETLAVFMVGALEGLSITPEKEGSGA